MGIFFPTNGSTGVISVPYQMPFRFLVCKCFHKNMRKLFRGSCMDTVWRTMHYGKNMCEGGSPYFESLWVKRLTRSEKRQLPDRIISSKNTPRTEKINRETQVQDERTAFIDKHSQYSTLYNIKMNWKNTSCEIAHFIYLFHYNIRRETS